MFGRWQSEVGTEISASVTGSRSDGGGSTKHLDVSVGAVSGLWPGRAMALPVTYTNPNSFDIQVTTYSVDVSSPKPSCPASKLQVPAGQVTLVAPVGLPPHHSASSNVPVKLAPTASDSCQGVEFDISVTASAVKR